MISDRIRREEGLSLVELGIVAALFMVVLGVVGSVMWSAFRTTTGGQQEAQVVDEARLALARVERDVRGARTHLPIECATPAASSGYCLQLDVQLGDRTSDYVRYTVREDTSGGQTRTVLRRESDCAANFSSCANSEELLDRLQNPIIAPSTPGFADARVFECTVAPNGGVRVNIHLVVGPLRTIGGDDGTLDTTTTATARNLVTC